MERGRRDNVVRLPPREKGMLSAQSRLQREAILHVGPERGGVHTGSRITIRQGHNESALQCRDMSPEFFGRFGEISAVKGSSKFVRLGNRLCFGSRILAGIVVE